MGILPIGFFNYWGILNPKNFIKAGEWNKEPGIGFGLLQNRNLDQVY